MRVCLVWAVCCMFALVVQGCRGSDGGLIEREIRVAGQPNDVWTESYITPRELEKREADARREVAHYQKLLQGDTPIYLRLSAYYKSLDRSRTNYKGIRSGYWPQGHYYYDLPIRGDELVKLRRIMARLEPVPLKGRPMRLIMKRDSMDPHGYSHVGLCMGHLAMISDPRASIVRKSQEREAMQNMRMSDCRYSLPDADYDAFMALPSIRRIYAVQGAYRNRPGCVF